MLDPFAAALDAQFNAPGSAAADYIVPGGPAVPIRIILSRPDVLNRFDDRRIATQTIIISIRKSDVAAPAVHDLIQMGARSDDGTLAVEAEYRLCDEPLSDVESLTWECGAELADVAR